MKDTAPKLDALLDAVDYHHLATSDYRPSDFALGFAAFVQLVNAGMPQQHATPAFHLAMLDRLAGDAAHVANLCFRGAAKTTLFAEYLILYIAVFGSLPHLGKVSGMIYVSDSMDNGARSARKNIEHRYRNSAFLQTWIPDARFRDGYLEFESQSGHALGVRLFGAKTGLRGTRIFGQRPQLAILDDLIGDKDAKSRASMELIKDTVYKGVFHAVDPVRHKIIFNGTPFGRDDIMVQAIESGAWQVNVWPVCERFPCPRDAFASAWPDRFDYDGVQRQYDVAKAAGRLGAFYQELMLRLSDDAERLVQDDEIAWFDRPALLAKREHANFYITTDFATSAKETADYSVISVWAFLGGIWHWVDGTCKRQTMDVTLDALFAFAKEYRPLSVGIEVSGQQGAFIQWIAKEMRARDCFFNLASSSGSTPGIRPTADKLSRFHLVVPLFKAGKIKFPEQMRDSDIMREFIDEIRMASFDGLRAKDDCLDTISMLVHMLPREAGAQGLDSMAATKSPAPASPLWPARNLAGHSASPLDGYTP